MNRKSLKRIALAAVIGVWTAAGETSDPMLSLAELPPDVTADCRPRTNCDTTLARHWLGRAAQGELFLVLRSGCRGDCAAWLVQRTSHGTRTLLAIAGEFRLVGASGVYPAVQVRSEMSAGAVTYTRYAWTGGGYQSVDTRRVYRVDGAECGTAEDCEAVARAALAVGDSDRAVRIYEQVRGIGWI